MADLDILAQPPLSDCADEYIADCGGAVAALNTLAESGCCCDPCGPCVECVRDGLGVNDPEWTCMRCMRCEALEVLEQLEASHG